MTDTSDSVLKYLLDYMFGGKLSVILSLCDRHVQKCIYFIYIFKYEISQTSMLHRILYMGNCMFRVGISNWIDIHL